VSTRQIDAEALAAIRAGDGPPLVLFHGGGASAEVTWGPLLDRFTDDYAVVAPDLPGSGQTPEQAAALELDQVVDRLIATTDRAGLEAFSLVGFSLTCSVCVRAAARHPERVNALVLIGGFAHADNRLRLAVDVWESLLDRGSLTLGRYLAYAGSSAGYLAGLSPEELDEFAMIVGDSVAPGASAQLQLVRRVDVRGDLAQVKAPTLVIGMLDDELARPEPSLEIHRTIPGSRHVQLQGGHVPMVEQPDELVATIRGFLARFRSDAR